MAYKYQLGTAILSCALKPGANNNFDLGADGEAWNDLHLSGTAYVVNLGTTGDPVDNIYTANLKATTDLDIGAHDFRAATLTADGLTASRVVFAGTDGVLSDDSDFTFATDTLTVTKIGAFEAAGAIDFSDEAMTNVNIDSGAIDGTTIGAASQSSVKATTISGSGQMDIVGAANLNGNLEVKGTVINFPNVGAASLDAADLFVSRDSTSGDLQVRTRTNVVSDIAGSNGGLAASSGVLTVTGSAMAAATVDVGSDSFAFFDYSAGGAIKYEAIADLVSGMAGTGLTATDGVLSSDASPSPTDHGNAAGTLVQGFNFSSIYFTAARTWTLPASPDLGDIVTIKAPANAETYALTIAGAGGLTIDGESSIIIDSDYGAVALVAASGSTTGVDWYIK